MGIKNQPQNKKELQKWLIEYHENGVKSGLEPPNLWDVSLITDMSYLFYKNGFNDFNENISNWNVSNVTNMGSMFAQSKAFNQQINEWNVSNVTNMKGMFSKSL